MGWPPFFSSSWIHGESSALLLQPDPRHGSQIHDVVMVAAAAAGSLFPLSFSSPAWWAADPVLWVVDLVLWGLGMVVAPRNFDRNQLAYNVLPTIHSVLLEYIVLPSS